MAYLLFQQGKDYSAEGTDFNNGSLSAAIKLLDVLREIRINGIPELIDFLNEI
jgi:NMD protein affecting ribosome stability and mRNA decay